MVGVRMIRCVMSEGVDMKNTKEYTKGMKVWLPRFQCLRCGHSWHPKAEAVPLRCAKCKTPYWDTHKKKANA